MNKLILPLILMSFLAHAQNEMSDSLSNTAIKNKFLTTVKDIEVEKKLGASSEFNDCRKKAKYDDAKNTDEKSAKLKAASECFDNILKNKPEAELKKLSSSLGLESYGLVKSNSVNDITEYLQNKMTKSLTGKDPDEKDPKKIMEQMKWSNQKIVDQKVFVELYTNQLMKNALFEVSRYCFENLRKSNQPGVTFSTHWGSNGIYHFPKQATKENIKDYTDLGNPPFTTFDKVDLADKKAVTESIVISLSDGGTIDPALYENFFNFCSSAIPLMCNEFSNAKKDTTSTDVTKVETPGAQSCLTMDRLRSLRKAMDDTKKVAKQFEEMGHVDGKLAIQMLSDPQIYGKSNTDESLDQLTSLSSTDMLVGSEKNKDLDKLKKDCATNKGGSECDDYIVESDGLENSLNNIEVEMTLKRDVEVARVKKLYDKKDDLKKYLTENGMYELLNLFEENNLSVEEIEKEISKIYDARKVAMVEGLKTKVGRRQLSEDEMKNVEDKDKGGIQSENIQSSMEEKARLAQVVMFNNIITSQLNLEDSKGNKLGRNVTAWNKEIKGITSAGGMKADDPYFTGLQGNAKGVKTIDNASLGDGGIIDTILGKKSK